MNADNFNMLIEDETGKQLECSIVARWQDKNDYIAYTTGSKTNDELDLFISRCILENDAIKLEPITDDEEWKRVNDFLDSHLYRGENK